MELLLISLKDIIYYMVIIICLITIAFILLKFWSMKKEEKEEIVVHKIENPKPKLEPKIEDVGEEQFSSELEEVLKQMQESLDQEKDVTQMFEEEQEEKAIISYQELVRANLKQEIKEEKKELPNIPEIEEIPDLEIKQEPKKFKQTDFISPIYGTMDVKSIPKKTKIDEIKDIDIEATLNLNGLSEEKKKNAEFLKSLKEFRNNL